jgi:hypothetical protein
VDVDSPARPKLNATAIPVKFCLSGCFCEGKNSIKNSCGHLKK